MNQSATTSLTAEQLTRLRDDIRQWATELGFQQAGIAGVALGEHEDLLQEWLEHGYHGEMDYMASHCNMRSRPAELLPGTLSMISVRMAYLPPDGNIRGQLGDPAKAYVSS